MPMVTIADIWAARPVVAEVAVRTPLVRLQVGEAEAPAEIYLKLENLQPIGSFKLRGAHNAMRALAPETLARGVLTASAGNMAQGVAYGARRLGIPCTVIAPENAPATKVRAVERLGGTVRRVPRERWWQTFQDRSYPGLEGATFVHAFDDDRVMAGNGTAGPEIREGAAACAVAAALAGDAGRGKVACVVSGGNIDFAVLTDILGEQG